MRRNVGRRSGGDPLALLDGLKKIEGRRWDATATTVRPETDGFRHYISRTRWAFAANVVVPHERYDERPFVTAPLADLTGSVKAAARAERRDVDDGWITARADDLGRNGRGEMHHGECEYRSRHALKDGLWRWGRQTMVMEYM